MTAPVRIGTRGSALALVQADAVAGELRKRFPDRAFEIVQIRTTGDIRKDEPLGALNLKGAFTKELDEALLDRRIDFAVHSLKDLPAEIPAELVLKSVALCKDPRDVLVSREKRVFAELPPGAKIGTSSSRRGALVRSLRPDLRVDVLRGNVDTRLSKLQRGEFDAIVLAAAGLLRLGKEAVVTEYLDPRRFVPPVGQGMLALVCRGDDTETGRILEILDDPPQHAAALAQRRFMARMEGGCQIPLGCHGEVRGDSLELLGYLATPDGALEVRKEVLGSLSDPVGLADRLADEVLRGGGREILKKLRPV